MHLLIHHLPQAPHPHPRRRIGLLDLAQMLYRAIRALLPPLTFAFHPLPTSFLLTSPVPPPLKSRSIPLAPPPPLRALGYTGPDLNRPALDRHAAAAEDLQRFGGGRASGEVDESVARIAAADGVDAHVDVGGGRGGEGEGGEKGGDFGRGYALEEVAEVDASALGD